VALQIYARSVHCWNPQNCSYLFVADSVGLSSFISTREKAKDKVMSCVTVVHVKVIETGTNWSPYATSHWCSIVAICPSSTVSEIYRFTGRKPAFFAVFIHLGARSYLKPLRGSTWDLGILVSKNWAHVIVDLLHFYANELQYSIYTNTTQSNHKRKVRICGMWSRRVPKAADCAMWRQLKFGDGSKGSHASRCSACSEKLAMWKVEDVKYGFG